jgi:hypothetical protein
VEFKSTARWSVKAGQLDRKLERVIVKTVCALLNAEGGTSHQINSPVDHRPGHVGPGRGSRAVIGIENGTVSGMVSAGMEGSGR